MTDENTPKTVQPPAEPKPEPKPGHIPVPPEKDWNAENPDPYAGIDRRDPFAGRPPSKVPQPAEPPTSDPDPGPGQPK
jgi:hypothetical protein